MRKKICFMIASLDNQGPVRVIYNIVKYMSKEKFEISIITLNPEKQTTIINKFKALDIEVYQCNFSTKKGIIFWKYKIDKILKVINPDIVHGHCIKSAFIINFLNFKGKKIFTIHEFGKETLKTKYGKIKGALINSIYMKSYKRYNLIACSKSLADKYKKDYGLIIESIQNGVEFEKIKNIKKQNIRKELGLVNNEKIIISVGSLCQIKNPLLIADAVERLVIKGENIKVIFLGEGEYMCELRKKKGTIVLGKVNNVEEYLEISDLFISSSYSEGLPNSVLEAMSKGKLLLLSNIQSHLELLEGVSNIDNYTFSPNNVKELEGKIMNLLRKNNEIISKLNYKRFKQNFTAEIMSKKYQYKYLEG